MLSLARARVKRAWIKRTTRFFLRADVSNLQDIKGVVRSTDLNLQLCSYISGVILSGHGVV